MRGLLPAAVGAATALLLAAGCGGGGGERAAVVGEAAERIPAAAPLVLSVNTDFDSDQVEALRALIDRFPSRDELYGGLRRQLELEGLDLDRDVEPAFGDEMDIVFLDFQGSDGEPTVVGLTRPDEPGKLRELIGRGDQPSVAEEDELVLKAFLQVS